MPIIAPWAQPWVKKAVSIDSKSPDINFAYHRLLRDCLLQSSSYLTSLGSNAFLSYSRILSILCLKRAEAVSLPKSENWALLKSLALLFQFDNGYSIALAHYIVDLLKLQPKGASADRNELFKLFGRICRDLTISASDANNLIQLATDTIATTSASTSKKDLFETGIMWSRIAASKFQLVPPSLLKELSTSLSSLSLPKLMASRNSIDQCIKLVDIASHLLFAMEKDSKNKTVASLLKHELSRIHELISSKADILKKFSNSEELQLRSMSYMAEFKFSSIVGHLLDILKDDNGAYTLETKKHALKCLLRRARRHGIADDLKNALFSEISIHRTSCISCQMSSHIDQIESIYLSSKLNMGIIAPIPGEELLFHSIYSLSAHPTSYSSSSSLSYGRPIRIVCNSQGNSSSHTEDTPKPTEMDPSLLAGFFDEMNTTGAVLETFNRFSMSTLQKLDILADFPDLQDRTFLSDLETELLHQIANAEESSHNGLLQFVQKFMTRPLPQRELIICILRAPKLLSNPLFLYHLSRVSLGFQSMVSSHQIGAAPVESRHHPSTLPSTRLVVDGSSASVVPSEKSDAQEKLRKRKELALKMVDDLEEEEVQSSKRVSPFNEPPSGGRTASRLQVMDVDAPEPSTKKTAAKKAKPTSSKSSAAVSPSSRDQQSKSKSRQKKEPEPRQVCHHWIQHKCYKGDECPFLHEGVQAVFDTICRFFRTGSCTKGASCPFSHDLKTEACTNLVSQGTCKYGDQCAYSHDSNKVEGAKRVAEERARKEALEKEEREKASQLPFSHFIVPLPSHDAPTSQASLQKDVTNNTIGITLVPDHRDAPTETETTSLETSSTPAYVPPSLSNLLLTHTSPGLAGTSLFGDHISPPKLVPSKLPSLTES